MQDWGRQIFGDRDPGLMNRAMPGRFLEPAMLPEGEDFRAGDQEMIEQLDIEWRAGFLHARRQLDVFLTGMSGATGMVVEKEQTLGIEFQGSLYEVAWVDGGAVDGTLEHDLGCHVAVLLVGKDGTETLRASALQKQAQIGLNLVGLIEHRLSGQIGGEISGFHLPDQGKKYSSFVANTFNVFQFG